MALSGKLRFSVKLKFQDRSEFEKKHIVKKILIFYVDIESKICYISIVSYICNALLLSVCKELTVSIEWDLEQNKRMVVVL